MSIKFIAGVALGAAIMHFLNTEEGQAFIARFTRDINRAGDDLADFADNIVSKGKDLFGEEREPKPQESVVVLVETNTVI
jgi:hypothetical protein